MAEEEAQKANKGLWNTKATAPDSIHRTFVKCTESVEHSQKYYSSICGKNNNDCIVEGIV